MENTLLFHRAVTAEIFSVFIYQPTMTIFKSNYLKLLILCVVGCFYFIFFLFIPFCLNHSFVSVYCSLLGTYGFKCIHSMCSSIKMSFIFIRLCQTLLNKQKFCKSNYSHCVCESLKKTQKMCTA